MNPLLSAISRYFPRTHRNRGHIRTDHRKTRRTRPYLEPLEERRVPASLSVADVTVREGPASLGTLDPAGAVALGLDHPRLIAFNDQPGHAHYHDLFVTSQRNQEVLRFDWASQTYQPFIAPHSAGMTDLTGLAFGPDGNLYLSTGAQSSVLEFDGTTGSFLATFVSAGSGGLNWASGMAFASDGNLYVCSRDSNQILKYEGPGSPDGVLPGQFLGVFANTTTHTAPYNFSVGPDGNWYVSCPQTDANAVSHGSFIDRYYAPSSPLAGQFIDTFVANGTGGLTNGRSPLFDQQGNLYIADQNLNEVLEFQGPNGSNPGAYIQAYVATGQGDLALPNGLAIGPDGNLYVGSYNAAQVTRYAPSSQASFVVTLDSASTSQISVNYATANGTAVAGTDYTQTSGTLVFAPGVTTQTVNVPIITVATGGPSKTFTLNLSMPVNASIADDQATGRILNRMTKFFVVDSGTSAKTYQYGSGGTSEEISPQASGDTAPRGVATTSAGKTVWVADANQTVYVYSNHGVLLGSWVAGGLSPTAQVEGIATNGTDIWIVDAKQDKVFKYTGAASRTSGSQNAASSFNLNSGNSNAKGIVTDGTSLWVVDDGSSTDKVFKYNLSGTLLGSWTIDAANSHPTGLTINPTNVSDIWIVDSGTKKVYQYTAAAGRTSGSQNAAATFALASGNTNPQDIADPPTPGMRLSPAAISSSSNGEGTTAPSSLNIPSSGIPSSSSPMSVVDQLFANFARILSDATNAYQTELTAVTAMWQSADAVAMQHVDALLSMEAAAMGMSKDTLMRDLLFASPSSPNGV